MIVIADCFTEERLQLMEALGAELEVIPSVAGRPKVTAQDIDNMVARAAELAAQPGHSATDQFNNPYITPGHRDGLGAEIWEDTERPGDELLPRDGHRELADGRLGRAAAPRRLHPGARARRLRGDLRRRARHVPDPGLDGARDAAPVPERVDRVEAIGDEEALAMTLRLAREDGVFAGISTGANVAGVHRLAERLGPEAVIVTLAVDTGFKYLSVAPYAELA